METEVKKDKKNIIIVVLLVLVVVLSISFVYVMVNNNKYLGKGNSDSEIEESDNKKNVEKEDAESKKENSESKEVKTETKEDIEEKEEDKTKGRFRIPQNDNTVLFAGRVNDIKEKRKNYELGKKWDNQTISLENGVKAEISCLSFDGPAGSDSYYCEKIKIQINQFTIDSYDEMIGCGDGTYIIVTKDHIIKHKADGCGSGKGIEMDNGIIISNGPTNLSDLFEEFPSYIKLNNNKVYYKEYDVNKFNENGNENKIYAYDINTGTKQLMDTYYGVVSGQA